MFDPNPKAYSLTTKQLYTLKLSIPQRSHTSLLILSISTSICHFLSRSLFVFHLGEWAIDCMMKQKGQFIEGKKRETSVCNANTCYSCDRQCRETIDIDNNQSLSNTHTKYWARERPEWRLRLDLIYCSYERSTTVQVNQTKAYDMENIFFGII